jgi:HSP20 family protein
MNEMVAKKETEALKAEPTRPTLQFSPLVDVYETDHDLVFYADMPGVRPDDIHLRYEKGELTLTGHVRAEEMPGTERLHEYEVGDFVRTFSVHESIDPERISAELKNGVLAVKLPKREEAKPRQIKIQAN